ncbi:MAG: hypothetical protein AB1664_21040 [Thermodesulfobacteriota bacterium]
MKCDRCGFVSFDYNLRCPACDRDLTLLRRKLGVYQEPPEVILEEVFTGGGSGVMKTMEAPARRDEAELDLEDVGEDFEFTLDD